MDEEKELNIKLDMSEFNKTMQTMTTKILDSLPAKDPEGKGQIVIEEKERKDKVARLVENLREVSKEGWVMKEQWTVVVPYARTREVAAHLRDHVYVSDAVKGDNKPGDVVNIAYTTDCAFQILSAVGNTFKAAWTGLISSTTTTLYEAGGYYDAPYYLLERVNQNVMEQLNGVLAVGAVRAEDEEIMTLINATTLTSLAGQVGRTTATGAYFYSANIAKAMGALLKAGKDVKPGECVAYLTPQAYQSVLEELTASTVIAYAQPAIITQGQVESFLGVKLVVGPALRKCRTAGATGTVDVCFLMRGKRAVVLAPKRDILIETQKRVAERQLRIVPSHTFGVKVLDAGEIVRMWTSFTS